MKPHSLWQVTQSFHNQGPNAEGCNCIKLFFPSTRCLIVINTLRVCCASCNWSTSLKTEARSPRDLAVSGCSGPSTRCLIARDSLCHCSASCRLPRSDPAVCLGLGEPMPGCSEMRLFLGAQAPAHAAWLPSTPCAAALLLAGCLGLGEPMPGNSEMWLWQGAQAPAHAS